MARALNAIAQAHPSALARYRSASSPAQVGDQLSTIKRERKMNGLYRHKPPPELAGLSCDSGLTSNRWSESSRRWSNPGIEQSTQLPAGLGTRAKFGVSGQEPKRAGPRSRNLPTVNQQIGVAPTNRKQRSCTFKDFTTRAIPFAAAAGAGASNGAGDRRQSGAAADDRLVDAGVEEADAAVARNASADAGSR